MANELVYKRATIDDWPRLFDLYCHAYSVNHPLQNIDFWKWQFGDPVHGTAYILTDQDKIYGHVGTYFNGGVGWMLNAYLFAEHRGGEVMNRLYAMAREDYGNLATTSANVNGLGMYRKMKWIRYANLERYIYIRPDLKNKVAAELITGISKITDFQTPVGDHYWKQPGIRGIELSDGSTGVLQEQVGGFRLIQLNSDEALEEIWSLGFNWCDYVTSWNDTRLIGMKRKGWIDHQQSDLPWYLNPVDYSKKCAISFLSEHELPQDYVCKRSYCDYGRIGSLPQKR